MELNGEPHNTRSDNIAELTATAAMRSRRDRNVGPAFITPGSTWQNGYARSSHGKLRDECLNLEWLRVARENRTIIAD
jgi:putative transposase